MNSSDLELILRIRRELGRSNCLHKERINHPDWSSVCNYMAKAPAACQSFLSALKSQAESEFAVALEDLRAAQTRALTVVAQTYEAEELRLTQHLQQALFTLEELCEDWNSPAVSQDLKTLVSKQTTQAEHFPAILRAFTIDCDLELAEVVTKSCFRSESSFPQYLQTMLSPTLRPLAHSKQQRLLHSLASSRQCSDLQFAYHQCRFPLTPASAELQTLKTALETSLQTAFHARQSQLTALLAADSESVVALTKGKTRSAMELWDAGKATEAVFAMEKFARWLKSVSRSRSTAEVFLKLAACYEEVEENYPAVEALYREALEVAEELHSSESDMAGILHQWGLKLSHFGKERDAKTVLREALRLAPQNEAILDSLSVLTIGQTAVQPEVSFAAQPQSFPAALVDQSAGLSQLQAAEICLEIGDNEQAESRLQSAISSFQLPSPAALPAFRLLTTLYTNQGKVRDAEVVLGQWLEAVDSEELKAEVYEYQAELHLVTGNYSEAEDNVVLGLQQLTEKRNSQACCGLYRKLGDIYQAQRRWEEAMASFNKAYVQQYTISPTGPEFASILLGMASVYHHLNDLSEEERCCKLAVDHLLQFHPHSQELPKAFKALIQAYLIQKKYVEAEITFDELSKLLVRPDASDYVELWTKRAGLNRLLGRDDLAKSFFFMALSASIVLKNEESVREIIEELEKLDHREDLISLESCYLSIIEAFAPQASALLESCYSHMGTSQLSRGDLEGAYTSLTTALRIQQEISIETWENANLTKWITIVVIKQKKETEAEALIQGLTDLLGRLGTAAKVKEVLGEVAAESEKAELQGLTQLLQQVIASLGQ